jgi:hypothetical protein
MTTLRCPVCRADNTTGPACRRCKADLGLLWQIEVERRRQLSAAVALIRQSEWERALAALDKVDALRAGDDARRLRAACHLLRRDFAAAWRVRATLTGGA